MGKMYQQSLGVRRQGDALLFLRDDGVRDTIYVPCTHGEDEMGRG